MVGFHGKGKTIFGGDEVGIVDGQISQ
jgi:hypothetical protein